MEETYSNEYEKYLCKHGIQHQSIVPYNSQQNYVVEGMTITILNIVHSIRILKNITFMFWDNMSLCAIYVKNICSSHTLRKILLAKCCMDAILW